MPTWDSDQYLKFAAERTRPAEDLVKQIPLGNPRRVMDLGCGPGNSTALLASRWPTARIHGLDSSTTMILAARTTNPSTYWEAGDIATWQAAQPFDVVFSNAALQWVPDHARVVPHLLSQVAPDGVFAFQVPANFDAPPHRLMREIGASAKWSSRFRHAVREWHVEEPSFYYDALSAKAAKLNLWLTEYIHILPSPEAIVEWYRGTGLRSWLEALPDETTRADFLEDYLAEITKAFPRQSDGCVLFPFRRLFVVAHR